MRKINVSGAALITSPSNLFYFCGYKNSDARLIFFDGGIYYFTDARYFEEVNACITDAEILDIKEFDNFLRKNKLTRLYIEDSLEYSRFLALKSLGVTEFISVTPQINGLRAIKTPAEVEMIKAAQAITDKTFSELLGYIKEGITERELSGTLSALLFKNGADGAAFENIVAFGKNTSKPHAHPTDTKLGKGMAITLDFGAKLDNYCSDMTRTIFFGKPSDEMIKTYNIVLEAQKIALENIRTGMTGIECDNLARAHFAKVGLDRYFLHSLGHSLGIDIHETPSFSPKCDTVMEENMIMSVEPGLYFENSFGIRIEDIICFDKISANNLTKSEKNVIII